MSPEEERSLLVTGLYLIFHLLALLCLLCAGNVTCLEGTRYTSTVLVWKTKYEETNQESYSADGKILLNRCHIKMFRMLEWY